MTEAERAEILIRMDHEGVDEPVDPAELPSGLPPDVLHRYERFWAARYPTPADQTRERHRRASLAAAEAEAGGSDVPAEDIARYERLTEPVRRSLRQLRPMSPQ